MTELICFTVVDNTNTTRPIPGVLLSSTGGPGPWKAMSNDCGDCKVMLTPAPDYSITFTKTGWATRVLPATILESGIITVGLDRAVPVLPPIPTRAQVCSLKTSLAGLTYNTTQFGSIPAWFYGALNTEDRAIARAAHRAAGDTHVPFPVTEAYRESGTLWPAGLANGYDYTQVMDTYRVIAYELIADGFFIDCALGGDGLGSGPGYNDPVGRTYGNQWLVANLRDMIRVLQGDGTDARPDLTPYMIFRPGWDAVFYGWSESATQQMRLRWQAIDFPRPRLTRLQLDDQQRRVKEFGELFRQVLPHGYLSIEHTPGNIPCGEGGGDYAPGGLMRTYDTILSEFGTVHEDSCWQVVGRMVQPYHRPPDQPAGDDPSPPWYLAPGTERGPYFYVAFEPTKGGVYEWCRGRCSLADVQATRDYLKGLGCTLTG